MSFERELRKAVNDLGGWYNAHTHLDRAFVMESKYVEHADMDPWEIATYPLNAKQHTTGALHEGIAYTKESLEERMSRALETAIGHDTSRIDSFIDTTADIIGLRALEVALDLKERFKGRIEFRVGAYPIFGFIDSQKERWEIFEEGAKMADFIGTLPERDMRPGHIGFKDHFKRVIELGNKLEWKEIHMQVDQTNRPEEVGTETLIEAVRWLRPDTRGHAQGRQPTIWAVHAVSIASYNEERFQKVLEGLIETNIGIIVCPSATLSNKQDRNILVPMHNSITRVLDLLLADIPVRIGTDNTEDFFMPAGSLDMLLEMRDAANALRFYNFTTWARVGAGNRLNEVDKMKIRNAMNS